MNNEDQPRDGSPQGPWLRKAIRHIAGELARMDPRRAHVRRLRQVLQTNALETGA